MSKSQSHKDKDRYHKEIGFPANIELPTGTMFLYSTEHARNEAEKDRYGHFDLPTRQDITEEMYRRDPQEAIGGKLYGVAQEEDVIETGFNSKDEAREWAEEESLEEYDIIEQDEREKTEPHIFELTVDDEEVTRFALRKHCDEKRDKILIINPEDEHTVTAWSNLKDDPHESLREEEYEVPEETLE